MNQKGKKVEDDNFCVDCVCIEHFLKSFFCIIGSNNDDYYTKNRTKNINCSDNDEINKKYTKKKVEIVNNYIK